MEMGGCNSDDHYIYYCGQESLTRNGVAIKVNKRVQNGVLGCSLKNDKIISVHFQGKLVNITVIQVYALTTNAEELKWFYEELRDLEATRKKNILFFRGPCSAVCGIFVPDHSSHPCPLHWEHRVLTIGPPGSP